MPDAFARLVRKLLEEGQAPRSQFSARSLKDLGALMDAGVLFKKRSGAGLVICVENQDALRTFYRSCYPSEGQVVDGPPRAGAIGALRNAKRARRTDMEPVLLRAMTKTVCRRGDAECDLQAMTRRTGAACLVLHPDSFWSFKGTVAVVENLECFLHFEDMHVSADLALYASGRLSELVLSWLGSDQLPQCRFIHCGDYDPVGLDEYLRLKAVVGRRARLHLPADLERLVSQYGRQELLRDSERVLKKLRGATDKDVRKVVNILDETGCGLEQEILLIT